MIKTRPGHNLKVVLQGEINRFDNTVDRSIFRADQFNLDSNCLLSFVGTESIDQCELALRQEGHVYRCHRVKSPPSVRRAMSLTNPTYSMRIQT